VATRQVLRIVIGRRDGSVMNYRNRAKLLNRVNIKLNSQKKLKKVGKHLLQIIFLLFNCFDVGC